MIRGDFVRFAIDRFYSGTEKEVRASEFYNTYIPQKKTRFYCPECGERVFWRSRGGNKLDDEFYHQEKTETSPECEKRVDGSSNLYFYERLGLPLYLTKISEDRFQLNVVFPKLGTNVMNRCEACEAKVEVYSSDKKITKSINSINFYEDQSTLIPIDFIPNSGKNFSIDITPYIIKNEVLRKWSNYADGFSSTSALFEFSETGGKKCRRGDSICVGKEYYLISSDFRSYYPEIKCEQLGKIFLNGRYLYVYKFRIDLSNTEMFNRISNFVYSTFKVWLLWKKPEIIPLWPPVIEKDGLILGTHTKEVFASVISGNQNPTVYIYDRCSASVFKDVDISNGYSIINIPIAYGSEIVLSVDRKYTGSEIRLKNIGVNYSEYTPEYYVLDKEQNIIAREDLRTEHITKNFSIVASSKIRLILENKYNSFSDIKIEETPYHIANDVVTKTLYILFNQEIIEILDVGVIENETSIDQNEWIYILHKHRNGLLVLPSVHTTRLLRDIKKTSADMLYKYIKNRVRSGFLYSGEEVVLSKLREDLKNG